MFQAKLSVLFQANELLLSGRKLTAQEACCKGLVSQVLWPGTFTQEVMLRIKELVTVDSLVSFFIFIPVCSSSSSSSSPSVSCWFHFLSCRS